MKNKLSLLSDITFKDGFKIRYPYHVKDDDLNPEFTFKLTNNEPSWYISQWFSNGSVSKLIDVKHEGYSLKDDYKSVVVNNNNVTLHINGSLEYQKAREANEAWPHLLLEQIYQENIIYKLNNYDEMHMQISFDYLKFINHMNKDFDPNIHTAQFQWFINVANKNKDSLGFGDFFWFGLSFLDTPRYDFPVEFKQVDAGKEDATCKFIYILDSKKYLSKPIEVNDHVDINFEVLSYLKKGFEEAKSRGFLQNTEYEDLYLNSTNVGFEITGTFDIGVRINSINIETRKTK